MQGVIKTMSQSSSLHHLINDSVLENLLVNKDKRKLVKKDMSRNKS
jgi:hypothetical protein